MKHALLLSLLLAAGPILAQDFPATTVVCTAGDYVLRTPLADGETYAYRWERSFDGGGSWAATGDDTDSLVIASPTTGVSFRLHYATIVACVTDPGCRRTVGPTRIEVAIPEFAQGTSLCAGDTLFVGATPLTTGGNHRTVLRTAAGCDSVVTTFVQLLPVHDELYFVDLCPGETFRGRTFTADTLLTETLTASSGCDSTLRYEITVGLSGELTDVVGPQRICAGSVAELSAPGQFSAYAWSDGSTGPTITASRSGTYGLTVTDFRGCQIPLTHELAVIALRVDEVEVTPPACPDTETGQLLVAASGDTELLYAVNGTFQPDPQFTELAAGTYAVRVENADGCTAETTTEIGAPPPLALTSTAPEELRIERGDSVHLATEANFPVVAWTWTGGRQLSCADCPDPVAVPPADVSYTVTATAAGGCAVSKTFRFTVADNRRYYAPTAFSPNGDDLNGRWRILPGPRTRSISDFQIADRWGGVRYRQPAPELPPDAPALAWDGTDRGQPLPVGTYYFTAVLHFTDGSHRRVHGPITLIR